MTAANLKFSCPDMDEESVIFRALVNSNISKLVSKDISLFESIILNVFPSAVLPTSDHEDLLNAARQVRYYISQK